MELFELIERISVPDKWPGFHNADELNKMDEIAEEALARGTSDGYLAYVLITHQICDDPIRVLIAHCRFTLHLLVIPVGFGLRFSNETNNDDLFRLMTGQLIQVLDKSLDFDQKEEFISLCREMSDIRNQMAHQLAKRLDLDKLKETTQKYKTKITRAEELFWEADDNFRLFYKDEKKDDKWDWTLRETLEISTDEEELAECKRLVAIRKAAGYAIDL